jgi:prepilin-type N-terminal cleavage/methylation domain-containing protein
MHPLPRADERGLSLTELLIALVVLSVGILALARVFPAANRSQQQSKMAMEASYYAQERMERLASLAWSDTALTAGRHPAGTATEACGPTGAWHRYYQVSAMAAPLDDLKKVVVTVSWNNQRRDNRSTSATTYVRR